MVFMSKKRKREMRERRKKVKKTGSGPKKNNNNNNNNNNDYNNNYVVVNRSVRVVYRQQDDGERKEHSSDHSVNNNDESSHAHKSTQQQQQQQQNQDDHHHHDDVMVSDKVVIRIPSNTSNIKKFRKEARRKVRRRRNDNKLEVLFLNEDEPMPEDDNVPLLPPPSKKQKRQSSFFPNSINEILLQEKESKVKDKQKKKQQLEVSKLSDEEKSQYIGMDCEMVGVGAGGKQSALARVSIVDFDNNVLIDSFVQVEDKVTDYRTKISGVTSKDLDRESNRDVWTFTQCRREVEKLTHQKILVGHAIINDLKALWMTDHPKKDIRDTARFPDFMKVSGKNGGKLRPRRLKDLAKERLDMDIQRDNEAHSPVEDAIAAMELYKSVRGKWEKELLLKNTNSSSRK